MPKRKCSSIDSSLGQNLAYFRKVAGLTQQQVADALNLNRTTYTKYETGVSEPSIEILKKTAELLGVDISSLLNESMEQDNVAEPNLDDMPWLTAEQRNLLKKYELLDREEREEVNRHINQLCKNKI